MAAEFVCGVVVGAGVVLGAVGLLMIRVGKYLMARKALQ